MSVTETNPKSIFDPKQYPRQRLAENVHAWNCAHRRLLMEKLRLDIDSDRLKDRKKALQKAFDEFYGTHPEDGVSEDCAPLLDGLEPSGSPGTLKIELDLDSGALAAAQIFPQVKDRLTEKEYLDWMRAFLDTGDEILGTK